VPKDELSELKTQFLASLNHEIRTPLTGIMGMTDLLLETELTAEQREYVESTRVCAEDLLDIMNSTLELSALSANQILLEEADFPLCELLEMLVQEFEFKAKSKGLRILRNFDISLPEVVTGDALRLRRLLANIVSNAVKFTTEGHVEVGARAAAGEENEILLTVFVRDTGIGIPKEKLNFIFESFRQIEGGFARRYAGLGLGLAVTQKIVKLMSGEILVTSEVGKGSMFTVRVPLRVPRELTQRVRGERNGKMRILVVDDSPLAQTIAVHVLNRKDYEVDSARSGRAAVEAASENQYDLILMDLQMPDMDGIETAEGIRKVPGYAHTPILALTANGSSEDRTRCIQRGMQGFLAKPVQSTELLKTVERYLVPA
jgi:CheY-like chemotaxis protein